MEDDQPIRTMNNGSDRDPSLLKLCCAVCGPLTESEMRYYFPEADIPPEIERKAWLYQMIKQPDFPSLKKSFDSSPALQQLCSTIVSERLERSTAYDPIPEHTRHICAARYALLCGHVEDFLRFHRLSGGTNRTCARPLIESEIFWNSVLGENWKGAETVPSGQAREEIMTMLASRYSLFRVPEGVEVDVHCLPIMLSMGWTMLRGDPSVLFSLVNEADHESPKALIARACHDLWVGDWEHARNNFHSLFGARETMRYSISASCGGPLLLLALITAVRTNAPLRVINVWFSTARELMLSNIPAEDEERVADVEGFFDALELWDSVQNRKTRRVGSLKLVAPLPLLPIAMGSRSILQDTGLHLNFPKLIAAVRWSHEAGLKLLAQYAASALVNNPSLRSSSKHQLNEIIADCRSSPLFPEISLVLPEEDARWSRLSTLTQTLSLSGEERLYWDIYMDPSGSIDRLEPRFVATKLYSHGRKIEIDDVLDPSRINCQDEQDLVAVSLARALEHPPTDGILHIAALASHPRLRLVQGNYRRPVRLRTVRPSIDVSMDGDRLRLTMERGQFTHLSVEEDGTLSIPFFTPKMQTLVDYLGNGSVILDLTERDRVRWLLLSLSEHFEICGNIPKDLLKCTESSGKLIVLATRENDGYSLQLRIEHQPGLPEYSSPGEGQDILLLRTNKGLICVRRNRTEEVAAADSLLKTWGVVNTPGLDKCTLKISDRRSMLRMLYQGELAHVIFRWQKSHDCLRILHVRSDKLKIKANQAETGWLEIGAELAVDEKRVLSLSQLLSAYQKIDGDFVPLSETRFLHLPDSLSKKIKLLDSTLVHLQSKYFLPLATAPGFVNSWRGKLPSLLHTICEKFKEYDNKAAPRGLKVSLREYQLEGFRWLLSRARLGIGAILADDMGLGKTVQLLALLMARAKEGASLVVAPLSLCSNWVDECVRFAPSLHPVLFSDCKKSDFSSLSLGNNDLLLASYGQVSANPAFFSSYTWNVIALDEAQAMKNPSSRRAQVLCSLRASARVCITGTPVENSLLDLWSLVNFLNPHMLGPRSGFLKADKHLAQRVSRLVAPIVLRRTKAEVLPQLPPFTEVVIGVELSAEERALYESCRRRAKERVLEGDGATALLAELTHLRRMCCHGKLVLPSFEGRSSKLDSMVELVEELRAAGHRSLVFSQFTDVLDLAEQSLQEANISTLRMDGHTPPRRRTQLVKDFQEGDAQVFLISLMAGGTGLNLTAADYVIMLDPWWNPAVEAQAANRTHRIGQLNPVTVCRLIAHDTVEERVLKMHDAKQKLADAVIQERALPLEALRSLLSEGD